MAEVLIIDDDEQMCTLLSDTVRRMDHHAVCSITLEQGLETAVSGQFDVVLLDVNMPDGSGLDVIPRIRASAASPEVIIITGAGDPDGAEIAIKNGAWDYLQKPLSHKTIHLPINRVLQYRDSLKTAAQTTVALKRKGIVGNNLLMKSCMDALARAANSDANVLITGETGTGKELFAKALHDNSTRSQNNFVIVDCAALPETLVESVIFGHRKGAFTGAETTQDGLIKQADEGTLFLDEVGELPHSVQKKFLRVLQEHRFRPVGGKQEIKSQFRLVAATNRDLPAMVYASQFRRDLLYRINTSRIHLPPLREHTEDIEDIALHHLARLCRHNNIGIKGMSPEFIKALKLFEWPGNVRELVNTLESSLINALHDPVLLPIHLPINIRVSAARSEIEKSSSNGKPISRKKQNEDHFPSYRKYAETNEKNYIEELMSQYRGDIQGACKTSGLSRSRLYALMKKHDISR